jgi:hypothetical protein
VRYEDLVADPKAIVQLIQRRFGVAPADGQAEGSFANVESSTKTKQKDYSAYKEYYLKEKCVLCVVLVCFLTFMHACGYLSLQSNTCAISEKMVNWKIVGWYRD